MPKYPTATYKGTLGGFKNGAPTEVEGTFTLHGVSKPLKLTLDSFKCMPYPMDKKEHCGADATATFNRADYGLAFGDKYGFKMEVKLAIQVEAAARLASGLRATDLAGERQRGRETGRFDPEEIHQPGHPVHARIVDAEVGRRLAGPDDLRAHPGVGWRQSLRPPGRASRRGSR